MNNHYHDRLNLNKLNMTFTVVSFQCHTVMHTSLLSSFTVHTWYQLNNEWQYVIPYLQYFLHSVLAFPGLFCISASCCGICSWFLFHFSWKYKNMGVFYSLQISWAGDASLSITQCSFVQRRGWGNGWVGWLSPSCSPWKLSLTPLIVAAWACQR